MCLLDEYWVKVGVWINPHSIIRARGGRVFREGSVLLELSLVHVHRGKKKETYSACMPILMPTLIPVIFPHTTAVFCTTAAHVTAAVMSGRTYLCQSLQRRKGRRGRGQGRKEAHLIVLRSSCWGHNHHP